MDKNASCAKYMTERAILASRNEYVDQLNEIHFRFLGESRTFLSFNSAEDDTNNYYQEDYLNTLTPNGLPPHRGFDKNVIHAEIMIGQNAFKHVLIPRIQLSPPENEGYPFKFIRKQFPVRLCFSMTINKAQGQTIPTIPTVGLYLPQHVLEMHNNGLLDYVRTNLVRPERISESLWQQYIRYWNSE
ncbi:uncharacterized protein LOC107876684 [Capsicum annuum]|uniref:uncharacterized protein LOC107876684 n=1 Tax=Capsicum annuum TaxID=4072 RepID=UPI001FB18F8D|nr:uncharacterized protein LOC107876684 [Capsicum annuum]